MVTLQAVKNGVQMYLEQELISRIAGWQKWAIGAALAMGLDKADDFYNWLKDNELVKMLHVIDEDGMIDIDSVYVKFLEQARKSPATFTMPLLGTMTLKENDVEKIYKCIKQNS